MKNPFVVLIAIEDYKSRDLKDLRGVRDDLSDVAHLWKDIYGYDVSIVCSLKEVSDIYKKYGKNLGYPDYDDNKNNAIKACKKILSNKQEFNDYLIKIRTKIQTSNYDGLIFYYSGHGENAEIILRNGSNFNIKKRIANIFRNDQCTKLRGKPQILFFDTCRLPKSENEREEANHRSRRGGIKKLIHPYSGFTFIYANYEGYSVEDFRTGGIFTQAVRNVFEKPEKIKDKSLHELILDIRKETDRLTEKRNVCQLVTFEDAGLPIPVHFCQRQNTTSKSNCKCNTNTTINNKSTSSSQKQTGYKKLANLSKKEIETMFFSVNGVDPNYYKITSIDEIDEAQVSVNEDIYNSQMNRVRRSQTQENKGQEPKETEKWLWHGTNVQVIDRIVANGFDRNYATMSAYGIVKFFYILFVL